MLESPRYVFEDLDGVVASSVPPVASVQPRGDGEDDDGEDGDGEEDD